MSDLFQTKGCAWLSRWIWMDKAMLPRFVASSDASVIVQHLLQATNGCRII